MEQVRTLNALWSIIRFTFMTRMRSRTFIVVSVIFALIITGLFTVPPLISKLNLGEGNVADKIGVLDAPPAVLEGLTQYYARQDNPKFEILEIKGGEQQAREYLADGEIVGYLQLYDQGEAFPRAVYKSRGTMEFSTLDELQTALSMVKQQLAIQEVQLTPEQMEKLFTPVMLTSEQVSLNSEGGGKSIEEVMMAYILVYIMIFFLYMAVIMYGQMIATEITAEKSSRVMEILISSVSPIKQMAGKLIGICLLGLVQLLFFVAVIALNVTAVPGSLDMLDTIGFDLSKLEPSLFLYFIIFYLIGYFTYGTLSAAIGSMVSRTEELNQAITPIMVLIIIAFFIAFSGTQDPNTTLVTVTSYVPFLAPLIMFVRIGMSDPAVWEIWVSIGIQLVAIWGLSWLSAKIYRTGVLMYGKRPSLKELWKAMKAYGI
jgi:ABC-2 type transport system permease protein